MVFRAAFFCSVVLSILCLGRTSIARADALAELQAAEQQYDSAFADGHYREAEVAAKKMQAIVERSFNNHPVAIAGCCEHLAMAYHLQGRDIEAEPLQRRALALYEKLNGLDHTTVLNCLSHLAEILGGLGHYAEAQRLYKRVLAIREKDPTGDGPAQAESLRGYAMLFFEQRRYAEAEPLLQRALAIREKTVNADLAQVFNDLALVYDAQARYDLAETFYQRALAIYEKLRHLGVAGSIDNLAGFYVKLGKHTDAEALYRRALAIENDFGGPDNPYSAITLNNLATLYMGQDRYAEAEPLYQRALSIRERTLPANHPYIARSVDSLGRLYGNQGRYAEAEPLIKCAARIREKAFGPDNLDVAESLLALALIYGNQGRVEEAISRAERALRIQESSLGPNHDDLTLVLNCLAAWNSSQHRFEEAEQLSKRALSIIEHAFGPEHPDVATSVQFLGSIYRAQGRYAEAEALFRRALAIREKTLGSEHSAVAQACLALADSLFDHDQVEEAKSIADRAVGILKRGRAAPTLSFDCYNLRANIAWRQKRRGDALRDLQSALDFADQSRRQSGGAEQDRANYFGHFSHAFETMLDWQAELGDLSQAFQSLERSRSRSLIDQLERPGGDLLAGVPDVRANELRQRQTESRVRVASLEQQLRAVEADASLTDAQRAARREHIAAELPEAQNALFDVYRDICNASPAYRLSVGHDVKPASVDEIQAALAMRGALLLEYSFGGEAGYVFVVSADGEPRLVKLMVDDEQARGLGVKPGPLTADRLQEMMVVDGSELPKLLSNPRTASRAFPRLAALWTLLVPEDQRRALTTGAVKQLVVVSDGALALVPLETLVVELGESPRFLVDAGPPVLYAPSATILTNLINRPCDDDAPNQQPVLTIGNPIYGQPRSNAVAGESALAELAARSRYGSVGGTLSDLPYSATESAWVADVFKKHGLPVAALRREMASEFNVRGNLSGRRLLHFACHGLADQTYGNFFGCLAFTPGPRAATNPADDGFLTLPEIYELNLKSCDLAILSACQTNYGPQQKGEGVWALSRGFLVAGARRVVASNWLVDDEAAASLVSVFCAGIAKAQSKGETPDYAAALQRAKRWVRQQPKWSSPYYWGTFVLVGP